jgi:hypothetical protein
VPKYHTRSAASAGGRSYLPGHLRAVGERGHSLTPSLLPRARREDLAGNSGARLGGRPVGEGAAPIGLISFWPTRYRPRGRMTWRSIVANAKEFGEICLPSESHHAAGVRPTIRAARGGLQGIMRNQREGVDSIVGNGNYENDGHAIIHIHTVTITGTPKSEYQYLPTWFSARGSIHVDGTLCVRATRDRLADL